MSAEQIAADLGVEALAGSDGTVMQGEGVWQPAEDPAAAVHGADAVLLLTEWQQFRQLDWPALAAVMRQPAWLFDARAVADAAVARAAGLRVWVVGEGEGKAQGWWCPPGRGGGASEHPPQALDHKTVKPRKLRAAVRAYYAGIGSGSGSLR